MMPLPVVPQPFADEPLGSWLGRLAGRYRFSVADFNAHFGLGLDLGGPLAWLEPTMPTLASVDRIAALTRLPPPRVAALAHLSPSKGSADRVAYCERCVFLNHAELESPYWRAAWLDRRGETCAAEGRPLRWLRASQVRRCANMPSLVRVVGRLERRRGRWQ